jgi:hypothetical protein
LLGRGGGHGGAGLGHGAKGCCPEIGCKGRLRGLTGRAGWRDPTSNPHAPSRAHPLQARNPQQHPAEFEGVGAGAAEDLAGAAGGAGGLGHGHLVEDAAGAQGREPQRSIPTPSTVALRSAWLGGPCVAQGTGGSRIRYLGPLRGIHYIESNTCARLSRGCLATLRVFHRKYSSCGRSSRYLPT